MHARRGRIRQHDAHVVVSARGVDGKATRARGASGGFNNLATACGVGGDKIALTSAKRHSVPEESHRAETESTESLKLEAHRTSLSVIAMSCPDQSRSERSAEGLRWQRNVGDGRLFQPRGRHSYGCLQDSISE
eukprot:5552979-Pleurochrysis_carterae.AAC.1